MTRKSLIWMALLGIVAASGSYYVWCSLQWREAAAGEQQTRGEVRSEARIAASGAQLEAPAAGASALAVGAAPAAVNAAPVAAEPSSRLSVPGPVTLDARLGQSAVLPGFETRLHVALSLRGGPVLGGERPPANLVLVLDRSGSMKGERMVHARAAAKFLVGELRDGDRVSIVSYNTEATADQPSIVLDAVTRAQVLRAIDGIEVRGDTCISCGLTEAQEQMLRGRAEFARVGADPVSRVVVLSDGKATAGVRDTASLAALANTTRSSGAPVTTIGVGLGYNEDLMSEMALRGTGNHYFVEAPEALPTTLATELSALRNVVAREAVATLRMPAGTRLVRVFDREAQVFGDTATIDLGDLSADTEATVLAELAVVPGSIELAQPVVSLALSYRDTATGALQLADGTLEVAVTRDTSRVGSSFDQEVGARVDQAAIREALVLANTQARAGNLEEARKTIKKQSDESRSWRRRAGSGAAAAPRAQRSLEVLDKADRSFDAPMDPMSQPDELERTLKSNAEDAFELAL